MKIGRRASLWPGGMCCSWKIQKIVDVEQTKKSFLEYFNNAKDDEDKKKYAIMRHLKLFEAFDKAKEIMVSNILFTMGYYNYDVVQTKKDSLRKKAESIISKMKPIPHTKATYEGVPQIVYHHSNNKISKFKTPTFFATVDGAYEGDFLYCCVIDLKNPLDLRSKSYKDKDEWLKLIRDIFKDRDDLDVLMDFAYKYSDGYGFFKLVERGFGEPYDWETVFKYIKDNGYDGSIHRESDQSITNFFDGYIVMKPEQIQILNVQPRR